MEERLRFALGLPSATAASERDAQIRILSASGMSVKRIARLIPCSPITVQAALMTPEELEKTTTIPPHCTGWVDDWGTIQHDDATCPIHEGGYLPGTMAYDILRLRAAVQILGESVLAVIRGILNRRGPRSPW